MRNISARQRLAGVFAALALTAGTVGMTATAAQASPSGTTAVQQAGAVTPAARAGAAGSWQFRGIFPEPVSCHIAGIASGRQYVCNWSVFFWSLYTWEV